MKNFNFLEVMKNTAGTVFLLAAAFFVCSTFLSMRAVLADPVAPQFVASGTESPRSNSAAKSTRTVRGNTTSSTQRVSQGRTDAVTTSNRSVSGRAGASATNSQANSARNVVSRTAATPRGVTGNKNVVSRVAVTGAGAQARVSLQGPVIRGSKNNTSYQYLSNKLYTGNYSNIVDPTTGLISSEAYSNCMESYYTCMDEICTARNAAQRRCACAGRVRTFADAERKLEDANNELIKFSGEMALLLQSKGKDVSGAFQLTDAERVMNCVSWQDANKDGTATEEEMTDWCQSHAIYDTAKCGVNISPAYCSETGNSFGFDIKNLDGSGSDILASLRSWAEAKEKTMTITTNSSEDLFWSLENISNIVGGLTGGDLNLNQDGTLKDSLAETWGYELFEYAHNNVCNRVLDSCFNGIYEACGTPPSPGKKCTNGSTICPYNYNSIISVSNTGSYELNFVTGNTGYAGSSNAACYGYNSGSTDPYNNLRGPVADGRRSILQKYALDANADCDLYGDQLRQAAQKIGYQKVAAQQAVQKKRLEFAQAEVKETLDNAVAAGTNFNECISEIYDCYNTQVIANTSWSTSRIKTYCAQISNIPTCYNTMICNPTSAQFKVVIDVRDDTQCMNSQDHTKNTCRNVVTLNEILTKASALAIEIGHEAKGDSAAHREKCLQDAIGTGPDTIRNWQRP